MGAEALHDAGMQAQAGWLWRRTQRAGCMLPSMCVLVYFLHVCRESTKSHGQICRLHVLSLEQ
jgi:hypothetical protein